jgi:prepilin-type N-terminal cleavage/methylation domain-containing protein
MGMRGVMDGGGDSGFTLIEALVALVMVAVVAGTFYRGVALGGRGARAADRDAAALAVAESRVAEAVALGPRDDVERSGATDDGIAWVTTFAPYAAQAPLGQREPNRLTRVDVHVSWRDAPGRPVRSMTLTTLTSARTP